MSTCWRFYASRNISKSRKLFGVGVITHIRKANGKMEWKILWLREGKDFGWALINGDSVEVLCK